MKKGGFNLTIRSISRFWLRRLCEVSLLGCWTIIVLYVWARFIPTGYTLPIGLSITDLAAAIAAVGSFISLILCFWLPRRHETAIAVFVYTMLVVVVSTIIRTSGVLESPFLAMWIIVALFSGFLGIVVTASMALLVITQITLSTLQNGLAIQDILSYLFFGLLPLIFSIVIWGRTQQKKEHSTYSELENKLSTVEGKSDVVINTIDDGVLAISRDGNIELINPSAQRIIGWNQGDALGLNWKSVIKLVASDGKEAAENEHPIIQALHTNKPAHSDKLFLLTSSEKRILVSIVSSPVGNGEGIIVVFRDITKEKAEEREQAEFISTASHEMRTPVASIEGYLGLALNPATAQIDEKARDFITKAHQSAQHLGRLFQDLLDISRAEDGRLKSDPKVININDYIKTIFDGLVPKADEKQLHYVYTPNPDEASGERLLQPVFYANVDPDHLREVVDNLIENAIKYTPAGGEVVVNVTGNEKQVIISVKDSGIGIPAEDIPHLFQKFYRVDNSDTREIGGTGLGLYLSRRLVENMSGNLRVESEYKKGSTFFLELPRMNNDEAARKIQEQNTTPEMQQVTEDLEMQMQAMAMPQEIAAMNNADETPTQAAPTQPETINPPMQTLPPTPPTQMPTAPPQSPKISIPITVNQSSGSTQPTLAEIEQQLNTQRGQLSVPERK